MLLLTILLVAVKQSTEMDFDHVCPLASTLTPVPRPSLLKYNLIH